MLIISDSNIFIDMEVGGLIKHMFRLPETFGTPDTLFYEELQENHAELPQLGLQVMELRSDFITMAEEFIGRYKGPSLNDLLAMALAKQEECPLLTGDGKLRSAAENEAMEVHGTLWLVERLHMESIITTRRVEIAYEKMQLAERRLPWDEVQRQIQRFKS